jgi:hypothetical protein
MNLCRGKPAIRDYPSLLNFVVLAVRVLEYRFIKLPKLG